MEGKNNRDILLSSVPRSGTGLIWNILNHLFGENRIFVAHGYRVPFDYIVVPYRDFRDCLVSYRRWVNRTEEEEKKLREKKMSFFEVIKYTIIIRWHMRNLKKLEESGKKILWLRYEMFVKDYNYIFDKMEVYFNIKINENKRKELIKKYNIKSVKKITNVLGDFYSNYVMVFRGKHVYKGEVGGWKRIVPKRYHSILYFLLRKPLLKYNYSR